MQNQTIISKGKYSHPQTEGIVSLKHYFFVRDEKGQKRLLLRFFNERKDVCTKFAFVIRFLDSRGKVIDEEKFEASNIKINAKKPYTFDEAIFVNERCTTFTVEVLYATYDKYKYTNEGDSVAIEYDKPEIATQKSKKVAKHISAPRKIKLRSFKLSWVYMAFALCLLTVAITVICAQLFIYKATKDEFTLDGIEYEFVSKEQGTVKITGCTGTYKNIIIPSEIEGYRVVEVEDRAFYADKNLQKVRIEGVDIGANTFANCPNLTEVEIKSIGSIGQNAFANCYKLQKISISYPDVLSEVGEVLPKPTLQIGERAFSNCSKLQFVSIDQIANYQYNYRIFENDYSIKEMYLKNFAYIDESVKDAYGYEVTNQENSIARMFNSSYSYSYNTPKLEKIKIDYIDNIPSGFCQDFIFLKSFEIGESPVSTIGKSAFDGCVELTNLSFNFPVRIIEDRAFANTKITSFNATEISSIGKEAFFNCRALSQFSLAGNNTIKSIGDRAFKNCTSITSISLPSTLTELGRGALQNTSIKSFKYTNGGLEIKQGALNGCYQITELDLAQIPENGIGYLFVNPDNNIYGLSSDLLYTYTQELAKVKNLIKISVSGETTEIKGMAFAGCENLQALSLPNGITSIEEYAFANCKKLVDINVGNDVESIGQYAFKNTGITAFVLPEAMTVIPTGLFYDCKSLASVTFHENIEEIGNEAFKNCSSLNSINLINTKKIYDYAFENSGLTSIIIPATVEYTGYSILKDCNGITELTVPLTSENNRVIDYFVDFYWDSTTATESIEKITINAGDTIDSDTFGQIYNVEEIIIENGILVIESGAFDYLSELRRLSIPESVLVFDITSIEGAYRLYEICNLSTINLSLDNLPNTLYISTSADDIAPRVYSNGCEYAFYGDSWYLVNWDNEITDLAPDYEFIYSNSEDEFSYVQEWKIPPSLFRETDISSITLPSSVTEIGSRAFYACGASQISLSYDMPLERIEKGMFINCTSLKSIILPSYVGIIEENAFENCMSLTSISLSSNLSAIGDSAFYNCTSLMELDFPSYLLVIGDNAFYNCCNLEEIDFANVVEIGENAFNNCYSLVDVQLPNTLTYLGNGAFENCSSLENVSLSDSLDAINSRTFAFCYALDDVLVPDSVKTIEEYAFMDCTSLNCITLGSSVEVIDDYAFTGCYNIYDIYNLSHLEIEEGSQDLNGLARKAFVHTSLYEDKSRAATVSGLGEIRYCGSEWVVFSIDSSLSSINTSNLMYNYTSPTEIRFLSSSASNGYDYQIESIVFGNNVTQIHSYAFASLDKLKVVDFSQNRTLHHIEDSAFTECVRLMELYLPNNIETIGASAFSYCQKLLSVTLPSSLEGIGYDAFYGCEQLFEVIDVSPYIEVELGDYYYNGAVGYYAKNVFYSTTQALERLELDGFYFIRSGNTYYLHHYIGESCNVLTIPKISGYNISILANSFEGSNASSIVISESVTSINIDAYNYYVMDYVYYMGTRDDWSYVNKSGSYYYVYPKYYDDCVHDSDSWTYKNGAISTEYCELEWSVATQPTCYSYGEKIGRCGCDGCTYYETEMISKVSHSFDEDGLCIYCRREKKVITPENIDNYDDIFEIEYYGFSMDETGKLTTNALNGETAIIEITAYEDIEISYEALVLGGAYSLRINDGYYYYSTTVYPNQTRQDELVLYEGCTLTFEYTVYDSEAIINYIKILLD